MKICPRVLIFELSDRTLRIFRGYDFSIFLNIAILGFFTQIFEPAPPPPPLPVCLVMECPPGRSGSKKLFLTATKQEVYSYLGSQKMRTLRFFL